jgi:hypothetical protein
MEPSGRPIARGFGRYVVSILLSLLVTVLVMFLLPFEDLSPQTPGRTVTVVVFFTVFLILMTGDTVLEYYRGSHDDTAD